MTLTGPSLYPYSSAPQLTSSLPQRPLYPDANRSSMSVTGFASPMASSTAVTTGRSQWSAPYTSSGLTGLSAAFPAANNMSSNFQSSSAPYGQFSMPQSLSQTPFSVSPQNLPGSSTPGLASALSSLTDNSQPLTADAMGQKVGTVVASFMKENPALLEKLNGVDLDALAQDIGPKVEKARAQIQQALKKMPQAVDNRLIRMLDPGTRELATEFDQWLRKEPDPALLAEMAREERLKARQEATKTQRPGTSNGGAALDPFADNFLDEKPVTWKDKVLNAKDQLWLKAQSSWPLNRKQKPNDAGFELEDAFANLRSQPKPSVNVDGGLSEADLDALLGGGLTFKAQPKK